MFITKKKYKREIDRAFHAGYESAISGYLHEITNLIAEKKDNINIDAEFSEVTVDKETGEIITGGEN